MRWLACAFLALGTAANAQSSLWNTDGRFLSVSDSALTAEYLAVLAWPDSALQRIDPSSAGDGSESVLASLMAKEMSQRARAHKLRSAALRVGDYGDGVALLAASTALMMSQCREGALTTVFWTDSPRKTRAATLARQTIAGCRALRAITE